ncbi:ribonuclease HI [Magnetococcales bacterium HHB-1]
MNETITLYTDGACSGNPGPGGWGVLIRRTDQKDDTLSGFSSRTTNNRMEMLAAIRGLEYVMQSGTTTPITVVTDSSYLKNGITQWIIGWKRRGWRKADGKAVLNVDLWKQLDHLTQQNHIAWQWVRGHAGHTENEIADELARGGITQGQAGEIPEDTMGNQHKH